MNLVQWSILFIGYWVFMLELMICIIVSVIKKEKGHEAKLKIIIFISFLIVLYLLYFVGLQQDSTTLTYSNVLKAFTNSLQVFGSNFDVDIISIAMQTTIYRVAYYLNAISAAVFAIYTVIGLIQLVIMNKYRLTTYRKKNCIYIFGEIYQLEHFIESLSDPKSDFDAKNNKLILITPSAQNQNMKNMNLKIKYAHLSSDIEANCLRTIVNMKSGKKQSIVSLYTDSTKNTILISNIHTLLLESSLDLRAYVYMEDYENYDILDFDNAFSGRLSFFNYAMITSFNLVFNHPIVNSSKMVDHYMIIGFGDTNRQILKDYLITNTTSDSKTRYSIFSNDADITTSKFYQGILYFQSQFNEEEHLEKPHFETVTKNIEVIKCDVGMTEFYDEIDKSILKNERLIFIVSVGDDIFNIKTTQIIKRYIISKNLIKKVQIFTRIRNKNLDITKIFSNNDVLIEKFGDISDVYSYRNIIKQEYAIMSQRVHNAINDLPIPENDSELLEQWNNNSLYNRKSSIYAVLSIRNKLRLLGLDMIEAAEGISEDIYFSIYDPDNKRDKWSEVTSTLDAKKYFIDDVRNQLARNEHERWNNFMLFEGYTPMKLKELEKRMKEKEAKPTKDLLRKKNICITTFEGLLQLAEVLEKQNNSNNSNYFIDYINYDYRMMDRLPIILKGTKYKIVKIDIDER